MGVSAHYDYVIVGAGSAGCVLANRLTADGTTSVLLLEAGGWDRDPIIHIPLGWGHILKNRLHDWMYFAEPEAVVAGRGIECARGKVVGGSSSINAMAYVRGHRGDYDRWARSGLDLWSYDQVLPYFRRQEAWEKGADAFRGGQGELTTQFTRYEDPVVDAFIQAGSQAGYPLVGDYNGREQEGFSKWQMTVRNGRRCSAAVAFLRPALRRKNLRVQVGALVSRVLLEGGRAAGVEYILKGQAKTAFANRETILCGGVVNSPQLLMLSGIGDPEALGRVGIKTVNPLKGVGANLQDHLSVSVAYKRASRGLFHRAMRVDRLAHAMALAYFRGRGIASDLPAGAMAFVKSDVAQDLPDIQLLFNAGSMMARPYLAPFVKPFVDSFSCRPVLLRPESRGRLELASDDPAAPPRIFQNFLATDHDVRGMREGVRIVREIVAQSAMAPFAECETDPGASMKSDSDIDRFVRETSITVHHPAGTCRMGSERDPDAVLDQRFRVLGVDQLRVVDASAMPDLVGGNINAAVMMFAERAAEFIQQGDG